MKKVLFGIGLLISGMIGIATFTISGFLVVIGGGISPFGSFPDILGIISIPLFIAGFVIGMIGIKEKND